MPRHSTWLHLRLEVNVFIYKFLVLCFWHIKHSLTEPSVLKGIMNPIWGIGSIIRQELGSIWNFCALSLFPTAYLFFGSQGVIFFRTSCGYSWDCHQFLWVSGDFRHSYLTIFNYNDNIIPLVFFILRLYGKIFTQNWHKSTIIQGKFLHVME